MTLIDWTELARDDLFDIVSYLSDKGEEETGKRTVAAIVKATERLINSPLSGRPGSLDGTREIVLRKLPYIIVYHILTKNKVEILRVIHTSRLWPSPQ